MIRVSVVQKPVTNRYELSAVAHCRMRWRLLKIMSSNPNSVMFPHSLQKDSVGPGENCKRQISRIEGSKASKQCVRVCWIVAHTKCVEGDWHGGSSPPLPRALQASLVPTEFLVGQGCGVNIAKGGGRVWARQGKSKPGVLTTPAMAAATHLPKGHRWLPNATSKRKRRRNHQKKRLQKSSTSSSSTPKIESQLSSPTIPNLPPTPLN